MKRYFQLLALIFMILMASAANALAQETMRAATPRTGVNQTVLNSLSTLPEADTLVYFNTQRILNEAAPKLIPEKELAEMRQGFDLAKEHAGVDPSKIDYVVITVRFRKPAADLSFNPPEFMVVSGGDFSADSLLALARMAAGGMLRDEKYGTKTLGLMTIDPIAKQAEKNPVLKSFSEVGIVALNTNVIAIGTPAYLKAAVDASEGTGRISAERLSSLLRDPNALISASGSPWTSFSKSFGLRGTEANARTPRCDSQLGDFYLALTMDASNFMLRGSMNADNPDTATIITKLLAGLLAQAATVPDKTAQSALKTLAITAEENEVVLRADVPQQMVLDFIKQQMAPKKEESAPIQSPKPVKKKITVRRKRKSATR